MSAASDRLRELAANATPGPWIRATAANAPGDGPVVKNDDYFDWVATVQVSNTPNWRENARLIALAPDMAVLLARALDALEELRWSRSEGTPSRKEADAILADADTHWGSEA